MKKQITPFNVLLVDDEEEFIAITARRLRKRGFTVYCAFSGEEALEQLALPEAVDVVVLDVKMPGSDGIETLKAIKNRHPLVEVIMLTGHATVPTAIEALKYGAFDYLTKPCDIDTLIAKGGRAVARKKDREARILDVRMMPYISERERNSLISRILEN